MQCNIFITSAWICNVAWLDQKPVQLGLVDFNNSLFEKIMQIKYTTRTDAIFKQKNKTNFSKFDVGILGEVHNDYEHSPSVLGSDVQPGPSLCDPQHPGGQLLVSIGWLALVG